MRDTLRDVAEAAGAPPAIDRAASMQGLHRHMSENHGLAALAMDEFGKMMVDVSQGKASHQKELLDFITQLFGRSLGTVSPAPARQAKDTLGPIDKPFLCLLAFAAKDLVDGLQMAHITGGALNRRLIHADLTKYPMKQRGLPRPKEMPEMLKAALTVLRTGGTNLQSGAPDDVRIKGAQRDKVTVAGRQFTPVRFAAEAEDRLFEWIDVVGEKETDERVGDVWSRATELTVKVAGLIAIGDVVTCDVMMDAPTWRTVEITVSHTDLAIEILRRSMRTLERLATMEIHDSESQAVKMLLLTKIGAHEDGLTKSELTRKTQELSRRERDEALFDLTIGGLIKVEKMRGTRADSKKENPGPVAERYIRTWRELE